MINLLNKETNEGVVITYHHYVPEDKQMAEWYVDGTVSTDVATLEYKGRTLHLARNGEMYISIPAEDMETGEWVEHDININRYTDELERFAENDEELVALTHLWCVEREYEIYHNNPWWELYNDDLYPDGMVCESDFYGAIDEAIDFIKDDRNWTND
jgi:hypothetical protein